MRPIRTADRRPGSTAAALGSPADLTPANSTPVETPFKTLNVLKETTTTTTPDPTIERPLLWLSSNPPDPPETIFHQRLCKAFAEAGKGLPTRKHSETIYGLIPDDWEGFCDWLPNAASFKTMRTAGGLRTLIDFYNTDKERKQITTPLEGEQYPGALFNGKIHSTEWPQLTAAEQEKWRKYAPGGIA
jgi:hypothetical protein